jgi:hypothetical protein
MPQGSRIEVFRWLEIDQDKLSPRIGGGLVLQRTPKFYGGEAFNKILELYDIKNIYADKIAQGLLQKEEIVKYFCGNALKSISLNENFRLTFANYSMILLIDYKKESAWFLGIVENRLLFVNYYREVVPDILKESGVSLSGSFNRLLPIGWQNLYDVIINDFVQENPQVKTIEILSVITDVRWRQPILGIGINLLNSASLKTASDKISSILRKDIIF